LEELNRIALPRAPKPRKPSAAKAAPARDSGEDESLGETLAVSEPLAGDVVESVAVAPAEELREDPPVAPRTTPQRGTPSGAASRDGRKARRNGAHGAAR
jgi:hypothetical protein